MDSYKKLKEEGEKLGFTLTEKKIEQFKQYQEFLVEYNEKVNLTAVTETEEIIYKHFLDSMAFLTYIPIIGEEKVLDMGTGAGFPGVVLKIMNPNIKLTLVDTLEKRVKFLQELVTRLNLEEVNIFHSRGEELGKQAEHREMYDITTARAVANLGVLSELCIPLTKIGGYFVPMKGLKIEEEKEDVIKTLGGEIEERYEYQLREDITRSLIKIKKIRKTPEEYPRKTAKMKKNPL